MCVSTDNPAQPPPTPPLPQVGAAAGFLSRFTDVGSLPDAYWLLTGLQSLQGTSLPQGLLLEAGKTSGGPPGEVVVRVVLHPAYGSGGVPDCTVSGSAVMGKDVSVPLDFKGGHNDNTYRAGFTPTVLGEYRCGVWGVGCGVSWWVDAVCVLFKAVWCRQQCTAHNAQRHCHANTDTHNQQ